MNKLTNSLAAMAEAFQNKALIYPVDSNTNQPIVPRERAAHSRRQIELWGTLYPNAYFLAVPRREVMANPEAFENASQSFEDEANDPEALREKYTRELLAREQAKEAVIELVEADKPPMRVLKAADLRAMPQPVHVVQGLLMGNTVCVWSGTGSVGKTAALMGIAVAMGNDIPWLGRKVKQGRVLFVEAEGVSYLRYRLDAWLDHMGVTNDEHIDFATADAFSLRGVRELALANRYDLIVLDTFSALFNVANENDNAIISAQLKRLKGLRDELPGSCIVLVHHTTNQTDAKGRKSAKARGASAFRDDADTIILQMGIADDFFISTDPRDNGKQRDSAPLRITGLSLRDVSGSVVVVENDEQAQARADAQLIALLSCLVDGPLKSGALQKAFTDHKLGNASNRTFDDQRTRAIDLGLMTKGDGKQGVFTLSESGHTSVKVGAIRTVEKADTVPLETLKTALAVAA